ncbi:hypothetical protein FCR2A7T_02420 [Flavobacterium cauense R2A-7]|uniref:Dienelactone hydrolase n=1 Tax=Flavobacterium cauense R2A-7 TaxID=1341154 RepID=V6S5U3_9FLAO|nr:alpha/beta hydrolase [Flavobacterium cauense]ESU21784.1 hypothetical protein FCR2A7T_02420 [Flavobacterium cauense R2A-7]KGO81016.1 DeoR faimly transcriptional regulator [Flavobacterium cauense R2A-7]TWI12931.1 dienelactone hydrolase [Flavobacterium cauense R2A-7]
METDIRLASVTLKGDLIIPGGAFGIVVFSHGSGSSRFSTRNTFVAQFIRKHGMGSLLFDLLTEEEDQDYEKRFDIELLTQRLIEVTQWLQKTEVAKALPIGYFGASTGAASALGAAAYFGPMIKAVVSRGGRPDLAFTVLPSVTAPTLLIVGGRDSEVIDLNQFAYENLSCIRQFEIVDGATHLFEEPGAMEQVADLAVSWFEHYLKA